MRDPNRIPEFCNKLAEIWMKYPDLRFGQFMLNVLCNPHVPEHVIWIYEDDEMIKHIEHWMNIMINENNKVKTAEENNL